jgi:hypothetical protein
MSLPIKLNVDIKIDVSELIKQIGKKHWDKAFVDLYQAAEQRASQETLEKMRSEVFQVFQDIDERRITEYKKPDGTFADSVANEYTKKWAQFKQERLNYYLNMMLDLVKAEIQSKNK